MSGYQKDAEAWGREVRAVLARHRVYRHLGEAEGDYIKWAAAWAFHWANLALKYERT